MLNGEYKIRFCVLFIVLLALKLASATVLAELGTTALLYGESNAAAVIMFKYDDTKNADAQFKIKRVVLAQVVQQMSNFQSILNFTLNNSNSFTVYNATPNLQNWINTNPKLLNQFYSTKSVQIQDYESSNPSKLIASAVNTGVANNPNLNKLVLLGWVESIYEVESNTPVIDTNNSIFIYSVEIHCAYRVINFTTNEVVASFVAVGHGGVAKIWSVTNNPADNYDIKVVVNDMFTALAQDIYHILLVREDEYIKKKSNATKNKSSLPVSKK